MKEYYLIQYAIGMSICVTGIILFIVQALMINYWFSALIIIPLLGVGCYACTILFLQERDELKEKAQQTFQKVEDK